MTTLHSSASRIRTKLKKDNTKIPIDMNRVASIILGGGQGTRLFPLTLTRCKPAISFGGRYRLIDIPLSNSINSGCLKIYIITQFLSSSLHQHIFKTYRMGTFSQGFIELLAAEEKPNNTAWYQGPADAVRRNIEYFIEAPVDYFLILSGDQLYNMDFQNMLRFAKQTDADMVLATLPVCQADAKRMGVLKINKNSFITDFCEKPQEESLLDEMRVPKQILEKIDTDSKRNFSHLGSMGIYLFKRDALLRILEQDRREDFGKHLIPTLVKQGNVAAYIHDSYWEDIGTIESFYKANITLTQEDQPFNWHDENNPIFHMHDNLPGPKISNAQISHSIVCEGSVVDAQLITNSILGPRTIVKKGSIIHNSYLMGNDFYTPPINTGRLPEELQIGENCVIENAIIDKNAYLGKGVRLTNKKKLLNYNSDDIYIRDGIIVVTRGAYLADGYTL